MFTSKWLDLLWASIFSLAGIHLLVSFGCCSSIDKLNEEDFGKLVISNYGFLFLLGSCAPDMPGVICREDYPTADNSFAGLDSTFAMLFFVKRTGQSGEQDANG